MVLGRGGAGKSTFALALGAQTGLPVYELDSYFWQSGLRPLSPADWRRTQMLLVSEPGWVLDGDLGPYDVLDARLPVADTVILLDYAFLICAWRALRRSREGKEFWVWVWQYRRRHLGPLLRAVREHAPFAELHHLRSPREARRFLHALATSAG